MTRYEMQQLQPLIDAGTIEEVCPCEWRQNIVIEAAELRDGEIVRDVKPPPFMPPSHVYHHEPDDWWVFGDNSGHLRLRPNLTLRRVSSVEDVVADVSIVERDGRWVWLIENVAQSVPAATA